MRTRIALLTAFTSVLIPLIATIALAQDQQAPPPETPVQDQTAPAPAPAPAPVPAPTSAQNEQTQEPAAPAAPAAAPEQNQQAPAPAAAAPSQQAPAPEPPVAQVPPPPVGANARFTLNFKDASLDAVLDYLSEAAGFVVVKDVTVEGRVNVVSRQPVDADEAVNLLNTVLKDKGYAAIREGRTLKIVSLSDAKKANIPVRTGNDPNAIEPSDRVITQVIPLRFVDATKLKTDIASLMPSYADLSANASSNALILTDTEANVRRIMQIVRALDTHMADVTDVRVFQLTYANATSTAKLINDTFNEQTTATQQQQQVPGGGGGFRRFMQQQGGQGGQGQQNPNANEGMRTQRIIASADDRTNTVVVSGPPDVLEVVAGVIKKLDSNPTAEQAVFIYHVKNAKATDLEPVLNNLFGTGTGSTVPRTTTSASQATTRMQSQGRTGTTGFGSTQTQPRTQQTQTATRTGGGGGAGGFFGQLLGQMSATGTQTATGLAGQVYVVADQDSNSLMIMTASKNFDQVRAIIEELDKSVPQVVIKVLIAEVTYTSNIDYGTEFSILDVNAAGKGTSFVTDFGLAAAQTANGGLLFKLVEGDVTFALHALAKLGTVDVLSRPYILTSDNQPANITVGQTVPIITSSRITDTGETINSFTYQDLGIILDVTPHINQEGLVIMDVAPEISGLSSTTVPISATVSVPVIDKRSATSRVAIHDGQTIVIGGLMEDKKTDTVRKIPILGDIPLLGFFFRRTTTDKSKTELLIFLTPHVAQEAGLLKGMSADEMKGVKILPKAVEPGTFQEHLKGMSLGAAHNQSQSDAAQYQDKNNKAKP